MTNPNKSLLGKLVSNLIKEKLIITQINIGNLKKKLANLKGSYVRQIKVDRSKKTNK